MERQVLTLLRRVRNPRALAASPLMDAVCRATGEQDAVAALQQVVGAALAGEEQSLTRLRSAIIEVDFARTASNTELARRSGVSRRHFQRWRAQAVTAIARYAREILEELQTEPAEPVPETFARRRGACRQAYDGAWRFKKEREAFFRARDRANVLEMRSIAGSLLRWAENRDARIFARQCIAEANVHLGNADEAVEQLRGLPPNSSPMVRAKLALLQRNFEAAKAYAQGALAESNGDDRYRCLALIAQLRLAQGGAWGSPPELTGPRPQTWEGIAMEVADAYDLAHQGKWSDAERTALAAHRRSDSLGFQGLAARSAAVLAAVTEARAETTQSKQWRARAVERLLATQDRLLATGLFLPSQDREWCELDRWLNAAIYRRLCLVVPQMQGETDLQSAAVCGLLEAILDTRSSPLRDSNRLTTAVSRLAASDSAFVHYAGKLQEPIRDTLALAVSAMTGAPWIAVVEILREPLAEILLKLRPTALRTIAVAIPGYEKSQPAVTEHLRVDDRSSTGDAASIETLTDLRIRILPFRSGARIALSRHNGDTAPRAAGAVAGRADSR
ncbi:MAG: hypothetical protein WCB99_02675 [Candidatus Cybelea sp.]